MRLDASASGVYLIAVTPFTDSGALDLASTDRMVDFYLEKGATGLTVLGVMGEATKLTAEESRRFVERVLARVANRVPVVVGASSPGFAPMRELADSVMAMGAAGAMVAPPGTVRTRRSDRRVFRDGERNLGRGRAVGVAGPPGSNGSADVHLGDPAHHRQLAQLRDPRA